MTKPHLDLSREDQFRSAMKREQDRQKYKPKSIKPDPIIAEAVKETVQLMESKGLVVKKIKHLGNVT